MDERAFAAAVAQRAGITKEEARDLSRATLEELVGQLSGGEARQLTVVLPDGLSGQLREHDHGSRPVPMSDFIRRLAQRTGLSRNDVTRGVRAILVVLDRALDGDRLRHALSQLPADYRQLAAITA
jgi:uncharacterized protein (DUF2267 family)